MLLLHLSASNTCLIQRRQWHPTPVLLPGKSHGWRSLVGCSPWGLEESDMAERLHFHFSLLCIGEGNGNPLQCSCLENPRDGVAQRRTWLKWLSSSSNKDPGASQVVEVVKNQPANGRDTRETGLIPGLGRFRSRKWQPTPIFSSGKFHGQQSVAGYSP